MVIIQIEHVRITQVLTAHVIMHTYLSECEIWASQFLLIYSYKRLLHLFKMKLFASFVKTLMIYITWMKCSQTLRSAMMCIALFHLTSRRAMSSSTLSRKLRRKKEVSKWHIQLQFKQLHYKTFPGTLVTMTLVFENLKADHIIYLPGPEEASSPSNNTKVWKFSLVGLIFAFQDFAMRSVSVIERKWFSR